MPSEDKIVKLSQARTLYNDLRGRIENVVTNQIATIDTSKADKVTGATNGNFAALDSNGNLVDSNYNANDFAPIIYKKINNQSVISVTDGADNMPIRSLIAKIEPVQSGSGDPSPENVRPISGWTGAKVTRTGRNQFGGDDFATAILNSCNSSAYKTGDIVTLPSGSLNVNSSTADRVRIFDNKFDSGQYTIIIKQGNTANDISLFTLFYTDGTSVSITNSSYNATGNYWLLLTNANKTVRCLRMNRDSSSKIEYDVSKSGIYKGSVTYEEIEQYQAQSVSVSWQEIAGTVYGGTLDVTNGVLTVDRRYFDGGDVTWVKTGQDYKYGTFYVSNVSPKYLSTIPTVISSVYTSESATSASEDGDNYVWVRKVSSTTIRIYLKDTSKSELTAEQFKTAMSGVQFCYELTTPITYTLTPQEVTTLLGTNNIWADCGDVEIDYCADTKTYVDESIPAVPVQDVRVNGASILSDGVANVPLASTLTPGVARVDASYGISIGTAGLVAVVSASSNQAKLGTETYKPITPSVQNASTFYGLAKAAGDSTQSSSDNAVGTYTSEAKTAIQTMLDVPSNADVQQAIANVNTMKIHICTSLEYNAETNIPTVSQPDTQTLYLVPNGQENNLFVEWAYVNNAWERFGSADIDLSNYVQKDDYATSSDAGVVKTSTTYGTMMSSNGEIQTARSGSDAIKTGSDQYRPIVPYNQHQSSFYGLAKAAGDTTQASSDNAVGTYTDNAKTAIRNMIGAAAQSDIPSVPVQDVQVNGASILNNGIANVPVASASAPGVVMVDQAYGIIIHPTLGYLAVNQATDNDIKAGTVGQKPIVPYTQHASTFYGLAKAAGDNTQSASDNAVGTYTNSAKSAIRSMIGAASSNDIPSVPVQDVQVNGTSILSNGVANVPLASHNSSSSTPGVVKIGYYTYGLYLAGGELRLNIGYESTIKANGSGAFAPINMQHAMAFYGLARAAGDTTQAQSENAIGTYTNDAKSAIRTMIGAGTPLDVQINSSSIVSSGVANIPVANASNYGVIKVANYTWGVWMESGVLKINRANDAEVKAQSSNYVPITPVIQHAATFYGLAKAAGDTTQSQSNNAIGNYTESAKSAISQMLNAPVPVSGTTPSITAKAGVQYVCGEVSTLTIIVPESGCIDVIFESGSMQTILTVTPPTGMTMKWPDWFDPANLEANATYEINVLNGTLGAVGVWM